MKPIYWISGQTFYNRLIPICAPSHWNNGSDCHATIVEWQEKQYMPLAFVDHEDCG